VVHCTDLLLSSRDHLLLLLLLQVHVRVRVLLVELMLLACMKRVIVLLLLLLLLLGRGWRLVMVVSVVVMVVVVWRLDVHELRRDSSEILVLLLEFHSTILEPDLDLPLSQQQIVRYLDAAPPSEIPIVVELLLQFECLKASVRGSLALRFAH
jgi:hypothetical protein